MFVKVKKSKLNGTIRVPASKSHTIRAILLGTMAEGKSVIDNPLDSLDCLSAVDIARKFGASVDLKDEKWVVEGLSGKLKVPEGVLYTNNSGTTTYFAMGMAALSDGIITITGDEQICRRPVLELAEKLRELGAKVEFNKKGSTTPPISIEGPIHGGELTFSGFSSQFISAILLVAPLMEGDTIIKVEDPLEKPYLQMTIDWIKRYGIDVVMKDDFHYFEVKGSSAYRAINSVVPADWSGAAFPLIGAAITDSRLKLEGLDVDDCQGDKEVLYHLKDMGVDLQIDKEGMSVTVLGASALKAKEEIDLSDTPDALPALALCACFAKGDTKFTGLAHVRVKETDRVSVMHELLTKCGANIEIGPDYMIVHGGNILKSGKVDSHGDHRIAMAMTICGLASEGEMIVQNAECASVSFPGYYEKMKDVGARIVDC